MLWHQRSVERRCSGKIALGLHQLRCFGNHGIVRRIRRLSDQLFNQSSGWALVNLFVARRLDGKVSNHTGRRRGREHRRKQSRPDETHERYRMRQESRARGMTSIGG